VPAYVGASYRYKGECPSASTATPTRRARSFRPPPRVEIDSYHLVDLRAGMQFNDFDVALYVNNVFDEWAWTSFGSSFAVIPSGAPTRPRTVGAVLRWNFL
jgi:iron complex outermembrane recepter protein